MKLGKIKIILIVLISMISICAVLSGLQTCGWVSKLMAQNHYCLAAVNSGQAAQVSYSPNGQFIATQSLGTNIKIWQTDNYMLLAEQQLDVRHGLSFTPDSEYLLFLSNSNKNLQYWHINQQAFTDEFDSRGIGFALSKDGSMIAARGRIEIFLWRTNDRLLYRTIQVIEKFDPENNAIESINFSPNGSFLAVGTRNGSITTWKVDDGTLLHTTNKDDGRAENVVFSPDNRLLASSRFNRIKLWNIDDGSMLRALEGHSTFIEKLVFTPDGQFLISAGGWDGTIRIWRVDDGVLVRTLRLSWAFNAVWDIDISPDGKTLAASKRYGNVYLFDFQKLIEQ